MNALPNKLAIDFDMLEIKLRFMRLTSSCLPTLLDANNQKNERDNKRKERKKKVAVLGEIIYDCEMESYVILFFRSHTGTAIER